MKHSDVLPTDVIDMYQQGHSPATISKKHGIGSKAVTLMLIAHGVKLRTRAEAGLASWLTGTQRQGDRRKHKNLPEGTIVGRYVRGEPAYKLADKYGVSRPVIERLLREHGVKSRGLGEASRIRYSASTAEQRKNQTAIANNASRGRMASWEEKCKRALTLQEKGVMTPLEEKFFTALGSAGLIATPQVACGKYNFDLAFERAKLALEVQNKWHHSNRKRLQDISKLSHAISQGWIVFYVSEKDLHGMFFDVMCNNIRLITQTTRPGC